MITVSHEHAQMGYLIDDHLDHCRAGGLSGRTIRARLQVLRRLHADLPFGLAWAATEQIESWLGHVGWSRWTRCTYATHVRAFYRWATTAGLLDGDPTLSMARPKKPRCVPNPVTDEELARALDVVEPWRTAVLLAAYEGMRVSEIAAARREHVTEAFILIPHGKGGDPATVPTHPYVWSLLCDRPGGWLVPKRDGGAMNGDYISAHSQWHLRRLGLRDVRMHRFRHWYGTTIQTMGGDVRLTQECMRHASLASTQGYTLVAVGRLAGAVAQLPVFRTPAG